MSLIGSAETTIPIRFRLIRNWLKHGYIIQNQNPYIQEVQKRFRTMMHLGNYMLPLRGETYITKNKLKRAKPTEPHIFTDAQLEEFFRICDGLKAVKYPPYRHLVTPVMFRLIYCCGLRNSEACNLKCSEINLKDGTIKIHESKGHKNRVVYMSADLTELCRKYNSVMETKNPGREYFFHLVGQLTITILQSAGCLTTYLERLLSLKRPVRSQPVMG